MVTNPLTNAGCGSKSWGRQFACEAIHEQAIMGQYVFRRGIALTLLLLIPFVILAFLETQRVQVLPYAQPAAIAEKVRDVNKEGNFPHNYNAGCMIPTKPQVDKNRSKLELAISEQPELPHIKHFDFTINNKSMCAINGDKGVYFLLMVCSAPNNYPARQSVRNTWGSVKHLENWAIIRLVFMLGSVESNPELQSSVYNESLEHGDMILSSSFKDEYRNLTLKHLMGYQWATEYCRGAKFVIRTDDDIFIDIFQLYTFVSSNYGFNPVNLILCDPNIGMEPIRDPEGEFSPWFVTREEYTLDQYPPYCNGMGYLVTPDVVSRLLATSKTILLFWIDDAYMTGILREAAGQEITRLDLGYILDPTESLHWLNNSVHGKPPFTFASVEREESVMEQLWNKTRIAWSK